MAFASFLIALAMRRNVLFYFISLLLQISIFVLRIAILNNGKIPCGSKRLKFEFLQILPSVKESFHPKFGSDHKNTRCATVIKLDVSKGHYNYSFYPIKKSVSTPNERLMIRMTYLTTSMHPGVTNVYLESNSNLIFHQNQTCRQSFMNKAEITRKILTVAMII